MRLSLLSILSLLSCTFAAPSSQKELGFRRDLNTSSLPILNLPYQSYRASYYNNSADIYTFRNIRFAAPPVGDLRFAAPVAPDQNGTLADGSYGPKCPQANSSSSQRGTALAAYKNQVSSMPGLPSLPTLAGFNESTLLNLTNGFPSLGTPMDAPESEDCLFLDLYMPGNAVRSPSNSSLPIVVWIYGGDFVSGTKDAFSANGLLEAAENNLIFVTGNYRLGALGFMAGTTMEKEAFPNAGLADQRAVFQWVQKYATLIGGNSSDVSAWGESAGAGSIMHHLVWRGGDDPSFTKAVVQSPAFQIRLDRHGDLEKTFQNFTAYANCSDGGLSCLRNASSELVMQANSALCQAFDGTFPVGPSADGTNIRQLAPLEFASGNFFTGLDSLIISHVQDEALVFVDLNITTDDAFAGFVRDMLPTYSESSGINAAILQFYPGVNNSKGVNTTEVQRNLNFVRDSQFTTNTRFLTEAFPNQTYNFQYAFPPGAHGNDIEPTFYNPENQASKSYKLVNLLPGLTNVSLTYQKYLTSFSRSGDPNKYAMKNGSTPVIEWPHPSSVFSEHFNDVLSVNQSGFSLVTDYENPRSAAAFWIQVQSALTQVGGYAPPNSVLDQNLVPFNGNASTNF